MAAVLLATMSDDGIDYSGSVIMNADCIYNRALCRVRRKRKE